VKFRSATLALATAALLSGGAAPSAAAPAGGTNAGAAIPLLRIATNYQLPTLDPTKYSSATIVTALSMETLLSLGRQGQLLPELATSWSATSPVTYLYHLRHGVKFWDGDELTASDVAFSWNYERAPGSQYGTGFASVKKVSADGPYTVVVTLVHPDASWQDTPAFTGEIFEQKFFEAHSRTFGQPGTLIMGTGPWEVNKLDPTTGADLSANPQWWGGTAPIDHITFQIFANSTSEALAFRGGDEDLDPLVVGPKSFAASSGANIVAAPSCLNGMLDMNVHDPGWDDVHVRRAVAYALDRTDIIDAFGGYAVPDYTLIPASALRTIASQAQVNALFNSLPVYAYNLAKAKAEMAESAYPHGFTTPLLEYSYGNTVDVTEVIAAELAKIGIRAQIKVEPIDAYEAAETGPADKRLPTFQTGGCIGPDVSGYDFFLGSANLAPGQFNTADYAPPEVDQLLAAGIATSVPAKRFGVYSQLEQRLQEDLPYIALYQQDYCIALSKAFAIPDFNELAFMFDDYALQLKRAG
jgi:peptide/nickel transport system substrate-binding protein